MSQMLKANKTVGLQLGPKCAPQPPHARVVQRCQTSPCFVSCTAFCPAAAAVSKQHGKWILRAVRADQQVDVTDTATVQLIADLTKQVDGRLADTIKAASAAAQNVDLIVESELRDKVHNAVSRLQKGLLERESEVSCSHWHVHLTGRYSTGPVSWWLPVLMEQGE